MTNKEIAVAFDLLAKVMELHGENPFKIKSYQNAYLTLKKWDQPLSAYTLEELMQIKGIGEAIAEKIQALVQTGSMPTLDKYLAKTPKGVVEMLKINGLGPKKIASLWKEHGFTSPGELLYACNENRLIELKGFGTKSQEAIIKAIGFLQSAEGKYPIHRIEGQGNLILEKIQKAHPSSQNEITGAARRFELELDRLEILTTCKPEQLKTSFTEEELDWQLVSEEKAEVTWMEFLPLTFYFTDPLRFYTDLFKTTGPEYLVSKFSYSNNIDSEEKIFSDNKTTYLAPELRSVVGVLDISSSMIDGLIDRSSIKGLIHCHSTYSDGMSTLSEMAKTALQQGFEYMVITDHSQAAAYAKGLKPDRLIEQWKEIVTLNLSYSNFCILKGIECDILANGDLDYEMDILNQFEVVIASIHSAFNMDIDKATSRLIKAIEHPCTHILGHPTGRLILTREGYPIDVNKIIDACSANQVAIELNANPQRLDLDYRYIDQCMNKGVRIAINPDAHNQSAIKDIEYGIKAARKGLLTKSNCLNTYSVIELMAFCSKKK